MEPGDCTSGIKSSRLSQSCAELLCALSKPQAMGLSLTHRGKGAFPAFTMDQEHIHSHSHPRACCPLFGNWNGINPAGPGGPGFLSTDGTSEGKA